MIRLNKYLASSMIGSRRKAGVLIKAGRVTVNGHTVSDVSTMVDPDKVTVLVDNQLCVANEKKDYVIVNKPSGYVCTHAKFETEKSIFSILPEKYKQLKIAGRLDKDSEGLVLLTNDGDTIYQVTHPKFEHEKEYVVSVIEELLDRDIFKLKNGITLEEGIAKFDYIKKIGEKKYQIILHQGWNRQIKRMIGVVSNRALSIKRIRIGKLELGSLKAGEYKEITAQQIK
ncbi:pseudouridine synthase [Patescibacteria group bacterium]